MPAPARILASLVCDICGRTVDARHRHTTLTIAANTAGTAADSNGHDGPLTPPKEFRMFAAGKNPSTKGDFLFDDQAAEDVIAAAAAWGNRFPFDFNHAMVRPSESRDPAEEKKAAGQFTIELRDGELWATAIRWTPFAKAKLEAGEYTYFSPAFNVDDEERVAELTNCALTNLPAMHGLKQLVPASQDVSSAKRARNTPPASRRNTRTRTMTKAELKDKIHGMHEKIHGTMYDEDMRASCDEKMDEMSVDVLKAHHDKLAKLVPHDGAGADPGKDGPPKKADDDDDDAKGSAKAPPAKKTDDDSADRKADDDDDAAADRKASKGASDSVLLARIGQLEGSLKKLEDGRVSDARAVMLERAVKDGKLSPADASGKGERGEFIRSLSNHQLSLYISGATKLVNGTDTTQGVPPGGATSAAGSRVFSIELEKGEAPVSVTLSADEVEIAKKMGNALSDVARQKAVRAARSAN